MIKSLSSKTVAFDVAWVPCPEMARRVLGLPQRTSDEEAVQQVRLFPIYVAYLVPG